MNYSYDDNAWVFTAEEKRQEKELRNKMKNTRRIKCEEMDGVIKDDSGWELDNSFIDEWEYHDEYEQYAYEEYSDFED